MEQAQKIVDQIETNEAPQVEIKTSKTISQLTRTEREELNSLSKEVFGASSRWQKLVNKGYSKMVMEKVTELVPGEKEEDEPTTREVDVPVKTSFGALQSTQERHTVDSVRELMLRLKKQLDEYRARMEQLQAEAKAKKEAEDLAAKLQEEVGGSAGL